MGTQEQWLMLARSALAIVGGMLLQHGWVTDADWTTITGFVVALLPIIWGAIVWRKANIVKTAAAMPEVEKVVVKRTEEGYKLAEKTGSTPDAQVTVAEVKRP